MRRVLGRVVYSDSLLEGILDLAKAAVSAWSGNQVISGHGITLGPRSLVCHWECLAS